MTGNKSLIKDYVDHSEDGIEINLANNQTLVSKGTGNVPVQVKNENIKSISKVLFVPNLSANLLSVSQTVENGKSVVFSEEGCLIYNSENFSVTGEVVTEATQINGIYCLESTGSENVQANFVHAEGETLDSQNLWHRRLGHLNRVSMRLLKNKLAIGVNFTEEKGVKT